MIEITIIETIFAKENTFKIKISFLPLIEK